MPSILLKPVPHTEAVAWLKGKPSIASSVFGKLIPEIRARVFAVSGIESAKVLQSLRDRIADLPLGGDWDAIKRDLVNDISPFVAEGDDAEAAAERKAELLLRTHGYQSYAAAQYQVMDRQRDVFPYWRYNSAQDAHVRDSHRALDGVVLPHDDPFWTTHWPPWDYGCRCTTVGLSRSDVEDIAAEDQKKPADQRSILSPDQRRIMSTSGYLVRGPTTNIDVRSPRDRGRPDAYSWQPGELRLPVADLRKRYEAPVWSAFESFARKQSLDDGRTLWGWLEGDDTGSTTKPATPSPTPALPEEKPLRLTLPEPEPAPAKPRQAPVSQALQVKARGPVRKAVKRALELVDKAHDDGALPPLPVTGSAGHPGAYGAYRHAMGGAPVNIGVSEKSPHKLNTMTHELGHFLDHQALGEAGRFASQESPLLEGWRRVVADSGPIRRIQEKMETITHSGVRQHLDYLLRGREIWARAYAQYVATRTGDAEMLAELDSMRSKPGYGEYVTWTAEEFAPIAEEIDDVFRQKGWI